MALWNKTDNLAGKPKFVAKKAVFDSTQVDTTAETISLLGASTDFPTGTEVVYSVNGGTAIGGLTDGTTYYVHRNDSGHIALYDTQADAIAGGATGKINLTSAGIGAQILQSTGAANQGFDHNYNGRGLYFEDTNEATVAANRARGLKTPGWNTYISYTDANGNVRHKSETLVAVKATQAQSGDATDDAVLADS
jgi:hypothetical protein